MDEDVSSDPLEVLASIVFLAALSNASWEELRHRLSEAGIDAHDSVVDAYIAGFADGQRFEISKEEP